VGCRLPLVLVLPEPTVFSFLPLSVSFENAITEKTPLLDGPNTVVDWLGWGGYFSCSGQPASDSHVDLVNRL
jgi:hypothetical protein